MQAGTQSPQRSMIRVEELTKRYGETAAVDRVSFTVERGEVVGFLGPNGAGKSTTMRILTGFLQADGGAAWIGDARVDPDAIEVKRRIGYLPESTPLVRRMRVTESLDSVARLRGMTPAERRGALERVVEACGLAAWTRKRIRTLSKGYRQRVGLAQALVSDPEVLILDEPTSGLDPQERGRIRDLVRELGRTKTVLLSTHVLSEVQAVCQRAIILARGRVLADGPLRSLGDQLGGAGSSELGLTLSGLAHDARVEAELGALPGVEGIVRVDAAPATAGRASFLLRVSERETAAAGISDRARHFAWTILELRHEGPSLERVFLQLVEAFDEREGPA